MTRSSAPPWDTTAWTPCSTPCSSTSSTGYYNLFQPVMRLAEKTPVRDPTGRLHHVKRRFDTAHSPFQRLTPPAASSFKPSATPSTRFI